MSNKEQRLLDMCMQQIVSMFYPSKEIKELKHRHFLYLVEQIEDKSGIKISISTLKRLLKNNFQHAPHVTTLNALANVLDYPTWQDYVKAEKVNNPPSIPLSDLGKKRIPTRLIFSILGLIVVFSALFLLSNRSVSNASNEEFYISDEIEFSVKQTVDIGVPNSVIFSYDLKDSKADSFFIQRSWNPANKTLISPNDHHFADVYYSPGFHWAKLIANDIQIAAQRVHVKSDGWFASVKLHRKDPIPTFLNQENLIQNDALEISNDNYSESGVDIKKEFYLRYYNIRDFDNLSSHNFHLETRVKCSSPSQIICPYISIMLVTEKNVSYIDLTLPGCVAEMDLMFGDTVISGKNHDLSAMGTNVMEWQDLQWITLNKKVQLMLNGKEVLSTHFTEDFGDIVGIIYTFSGGGSVDYIHLQDENDRMVYSEEFNKPNS